MIKGPVADVCVISASVGTGHYRQEIHPTFGVIAYDIMEDKKQNAYWRSCCKLVKNGRDCQANTCGEGWLKYCDEEVGLGCNDMKTILG